MLLAKQSGFIFCSQILGILKFLLLSSTATTRVVLPSLETRLPILVPSTSISDTISFANGSKIKKLIYGTAQQKR